ncbi:hypothetical protein JN11_01958 [Mucilaginibacter frigoritolerans]|uniref:Adenylosuccinate lyase n=1 Tax=Mucilaginibacter frigoritolerans TaxID=652788 RepID=A0A562U4F9_9SPHI|nr:hypothetical protein [Mucilaginibacter frigoritolerans]TWJ00702.1 hypothetical protein JN11_01958 [Mucilaginibacter frigoritolerans]
MDNLLEQISDTIGKTKVLELSRILKEEQFDLHNLIELTFHPDKNIAFRAAWILENVFLQHPERYGNELEYFVSRIKDVKHASCKRHYAKIMMHITEAKVAISIKNKLAGLDMEPVVEQCFDWMIDPKVKVAVKCFASETLFNLRYRYPWIKEELANQIKFLMRNGSAGIQSRGKKILAQL